MLTHMFVWVGWGILGGIIHLRISVAVEGLKLNVMIWMWHLGRGHTLGKEWNMSDRGRGKFEVQCDMLQGEKRNGC